MESRNTEAHLTPAGVPGDYGENNIANYPAADLTVERIGDLVDCDLSTLPGKASSKF